MNRRRRPGSHAAATFALTVLLALAAYGMTLEPRHTAQAADSQVHSQLDQLVPAEVFD
ncbi:hypothetical protein [Acidovorax sp. MR-S7]|jgi:hypothetical protein|uniref:hypothetical protein n=1 Tax=Acidovorax sp. MR-S7 TaxID=1268622 RepID=UPI000377F78F|nr:hypothetical protein [Acidovorax sp. MR-S7]GAD24789.1 hypothetical protein AVS7_04549 [Acidovorax sp. MR-S7]